MALHAANSAWHFPLGPTAHARQAPQLMKSQLGSAVGVLMQNAMLAWQVTAQELHTMHVVKALYGMTPIGSTVNAHVWHIAWFKQELQSWMVVGAAQAPVGLPPAPLPEEVIEPEDEAATVVMVPEDDPATVVVVPEDEPVTVVPPVPVVVMCESPQLVWQPLLPAPPAPVVLKSPLRPARISQP
jgi:hypothetical protein